MTMFRVGPAGIPATLKTDMNSVLNKKFGTSTDYPPNDWPDTVDLMGPLEEKTVSGSIANFSDGADDVPLKSIVFNAEPIQASGSPTPSSPIPIYGHTEMNAVHCEKNLISTPAFDAVSLCFDFGKDVTVDNIAFSFVANGTISATNTAALIDYRKEDGTHGYKTLASFYDDNNVRWAPNTPQNGRFSIVSQNVTFRYIYIYYTTSRLGYSAFNADNITNWQVELGNVVSAYEAYHAETKKWTFPPFGKNLANFVNGYGINAQGHPEVINSRISTLDPIPIENGKEYKLYFTSTTGSCAGILAVFNGNTLVRRVISISSGTTLNTSDGDRFYLCLYGSGTSDIKTVENTSPMCLLSTESSTAYEPYQEMLYGSINALTGEVESITKKVNLNSLNWYKDIYGTTSIFRASLSDGNMTKGSSFISKCSIYSKDADLSANETYRTISNIMGCEIWIRDDSYSSGTSEDFKSAVQGELVYELATPRTASLDTVSWNSYLNENNIWNDAGDSSVTYRSRGTVYQYPEGEGVEF